MGSFKLEKETQALPVHILSDEFIEAQRKKTTQIQVTK